MIYVFIANGFEEIEALSVVDILRRAGSDVKIVGVGSNDIVGAHGINVIADIEQSNITFDGLEAIVLPGGMPGTLNLKKSQIVKDCINYCFNNNKYIAAICAAPLILGNMSLLNDRQAVCYPGFEGELIGAQVKDTSLCVDKNIITAKGPGASLDFAFKIVEVVYGYKKLLDIKDSMQCTL